MAKPKVSAGPNGFGYPAKAGVTIFECLKPDSVLPPDAGEEPAEAGGDSGTLALAGIGRTELGENMDAHCAATILTAQYWKACNGTVEMIRFGAMLMMVETGIARNLTREITGTGEQRITGREEGLKGWLESHCPEVNYKTAMRFKGLAEQVKRHCKIPDTLPLDRVLPGADGWVPVAERRKWLKKDRVSELQRAVFELVEGKSAKQLSFELRLFEEKDKGGRREGAGRPRLEATAETRAGACWELIRREIDASTAWGFERFLPEAMAREALSTVELLRDALKARLREFGKES